MFAGVFFGLTVASGFFGLGWGIQFAVAIVVDFLLGIWVYRDSQRHGMNGSKWFLIVLVTAVIGLGLYSLQRRRRRTPPASILRAVTVTARSTHIPKETLDCAMALWRETSLPPVVRG